MVSALYFENLYGRPFIGLKVLGNENRFVKTCMEEFCPKVLVHF